MAENETQNPDLQRALDVFRRKYDPYTELWGFYDGNHPDVYSRERLRKLRQFFGRIFDFKQNWCAVVIDAVANRINLGGFMVEGEGQRKDTLNKLWGDHYLQLQADDAHEAALVIGESYIIVETGGTEQERGKAYYNDPRFVHVFYEAGNPNKKEFAAKYWWVDKKTMRVTLYYPDRFEFYEARMQKDAKIGAIKSSAFSRVEAAEHPGGEAENPDNVIPVFHFRVKRRSVKSDLNDAIPIQMAQNKLVLDMMTAADTAAVIQKYVITNSDLSALQENPGDLWNIPASTEGEQGSAAGHFPFTPLKNFIEAIAANVEAMASITQTPRHYFFGSGGTPSGESLIALEAPLNKKANDRILAFSPTWQEIASFLLQIAGTAVDANLISPNWEPTETVQPLTRAQIRLSNRNAGMPWRTILEDEGWTEAEIEQFFKDKEAEQAAEAKQNQSSLAEALLDAQRRRDRGEAD